MGLEEPFLAPTFRMTASTTEMVQVCLLRPSSRKEQLKNNLLICVYRIECQDYSFHVRRLRYKGSRHAKVIYSDKPPSSWTSHSHGGNPALPVSANVRGDEPLPLDALVRRVLPGLAAGLNVGHASRLNASLTTARPVYRWLAPANLLRSIALIN